MTGWTNKQHVRTSDLHIHFRSSVSVFLIKSPVGNKDERSDTLDWSDLLIIFKVPAENRFIADPAPSDTVITHRDDRRLRHQLPLLTLTFDPDPDDSAHILTSLKVTSTLA